MPRSDALSNPGTSKVFLCLVKGSTNPKAIADELDISSPPVIQQLRRLQNLGLVELGSKEGKAQNYDVNWKALAERLVEEAIDENIAPGDLKLDPEKYAEETTRISSLKDSRFFQEFLKSYLQRFTDEKSRLGSESSNWPTIAEIVDNLNAVMTTLKSFAREEPFADPEMQDFHDKMVLWHERNTRSQTWMKDNMAKAIDETLNS
jgi:Mn-dependent DtxR family transcriptional regulator